MESAEEVNQISLYVQHDEHVQQVIDEQFLVQCWKGMDQGLVSYQDGFTNFMGKTLVKTMTASTKEENDEKTPSSQKIQKRILDMMVPMEPMTSQAPRPMAALTHAELESVLAEDNSNLIDIGSNPTEVKSKFEQKKSSKASGFIELVEAETGEPLTESTEVGTPVKLVIRLKQMASMDTMLSTCTAHSGDDFYDLTNFRGCTADPDILPNFKAFFNSRTGVKRLTSGFPMFKFPDQNKVIVRCTVLVCSKNCPLAKCEEDNPDHDFTDMRILDKFYLDTFAQVHDSGLRITAEAEPLENDPENPDQLIRTPFLRPEEQEERFETQNHYHKSQQQIESAAVSREQIDLEQQLNDVEDVEDLLCLSPSRLALAFGILLVILMLALLASCTMWMRARSHSKRPKPSAMFAPRPPRPPPPGALVPAGPAAPRGPFMVASRGAPYIRVVQ